MIDKYSADILVIDLETTIKNVGIDAIGTMKASPHSPKNRIVYIGQALPELKQASNPYLDVCNMYSLNIEDANFRDIKIMVGHNIKFDLLYMMRSKDFRDNKLPKLRIWDTMIVEYLITGQESKLASLNKLSGKYGGTQKIDEVKELWDKGIQTEDIDSNLIKKYLEGDLRNTELIFRKQLAKVKELNIMELVKTQMDAVLATTEMEYNGMYFDKAACDIVRIDLHTKLKNLKEQLITIMHSQMHLIIDRTTITPTSPQQVSTVLFGGDYAVIENMPVLNSDGTQMLYKTGPKKGTGKTKKVKQVYSTKGFALPYHITTPMSTPGIYQVDDQVLTTIKKTWREPHLIIFVDKLLQYRRLQKEYKTYYVGYSDLVWPHDNCIHPQFNHCITVTGRLSHSNPNLGNTSHKTIEET